MSLDATPNDSAPVPPIAVVARPAAARRRKRTGRWVALVLVLVGVGLVASTMRPGRGAFTYSKYVDEVLAEPQRYVGTEVRVEGIVTAHSIQNPPGSTDYDFRIERNQRSMPVHFSGIVPDTFREGIGVTVRGRLAQNGRFAADEVVAKCPSRYEMQAAAARGERMPAGMGAQPAQPTQTP
jgi:cytochrome c-type biogenesis protein CcmE